MHVKQLIFWGFYLLLPESAEGWIVNAHARQQMLRLHFQLLPLPKKRQLATRQNTEQCNVHRDRNVGSQCWSWLSTPLTVGRAAAAGGNSGGLPITTQHSTTALLCFLSSATVSSALLPSHQMYFPDEQVLLRCIFRWTPARRRRV